MDSELPKRLFVPGTEPEVGHINNYCTLAIIGKLKESFRNEYREVKRDPVFSQILGVRRNKLAYSARMIHSMLARQLETDKRHELWFEFARRPLRFSMQEYHAVTGLNCEVPQDVDNEEWVDDGGFWSKLLKRQEHVTLDTIWTQYVVGADDWRRVDRFRLVYLSLIAGVVLARGTKAVIPLKYIKVVMDVAKFRAYPWGRVGYDLLIKSVFKSKKKILKGAKSYVLEGFSYALQVWAMEAIPPVGKLLGTRLASEFKARCCNWKGAAKVSYDEIKELEKTIKSEDDIFAYISHTGNEDVTDNNLFNRPDVRDCRIDHLKVLISKKYDWSTHVWEALESDESVSIAVEEEEADVEKENEEVEGDFQRPTDGGSRRKRRIPDHGFQKRKQKLLFERSNPVEPVVNDDLKKFMQQMFDTAFTAMEEKMEQKIDSRMGGLECQFEQLRNEIKQFHGRDTATSAEVARGKETATSADTAKDVCDGGKQKGNMFDLNVCQNSDIVLNTPRSEFQKALPWYTPSSSFQPSRVKSPKHDIVIGENWGKVRWKELKLTDDPIDPDKFADFPLTHVPEELWEQFSEWSRNPVALNIGAHVFDSVMAQRITSPLKWLTNEDMDSVMFLWREQTTLRRWKPDRVAFMTCLFCLHLKASYSKFMADKKGFVMDEYMLGYGTGELPPRGRTRKIWGVDIDRIYFPLFVNGNHWISICVDILQRKVVVWDCFGCDYKGVAKQFAVMIPRIVKAVQPSITMKQFTVNKYSVIHVPMKRRLNKSCCDCGAYAIKFMECDLLGLDISLIDDANILGCRYKMAVDLWQAANDPELVDRMSRFEPPPSHHVDLT